MGGEIVITFVCLLFKVATQKLNWGMRQICVLFLQTNLAWRQLKLSQLLSVTYKACCAHI